MIDHPRHRSRTISTLLAKLPQIRLLGSLIITSILLSTARAAEPDAVSVDVEMVRPLIVQRTVVVAKFQPARIALPEMTEATQQESPAIVRQMDLQREALMETIRSLRTASGDQPIYATAGIPMAENDRPLFFVVESASDVDQSLLLDHLRIIGPEISARQRDGKLMIAPVKEERIDDVLDALDPVSREGLVLAFEAVSSYPIQLLVLPPDYLRRTITELVPRLPEELGGGSSEVLTEGILWAAFGFDPAELRAELVVQSASEAAAERLITHLLDTLKPDTPARDLLQAAFIVDPSADPQVFESWLSAVRPLVKLNREEDRVVLRLEEGKAMAETLPLLNRTAMKLQDRLRQSDHSEKFKQILLAMHNYHDTYRTLPPADKFRDEDGKASLSWRVHLLPFVDEVELFEQFRLDEPWDSPHNAQLVEKMPEIFSSRSPEKPGQTTFLAPVGEDTVFGGDKATRFQNITDGVSNTVVLVEVEPAFAVPWTAPRDLAFDPESPGEGLQIGNDGKFLAAMGDGSVQRLRGDVAAETLLHLFRKSDRNPIDWNAIR